MHNHARCDSACESRSPRDPPSDASRCQPRYRAGVAGGADLALLFARWRRETVAAAVGRWRSIAWRMQLVLCVHQCEPGFGDFGASTTDIMLRRVDPEAEPCRTGEVMTPIVATSSFIISASFGRARRFCHGAGCGDRTYLWTTRWVPLVNSSPRFSKIIERPKAARLVIMCQSQPCHDGGSDTAPTDSVRFVKMPDLTLHA